MKEYIVHMQPIVADTADATDNKVKGMKVRLRARSLRNARRKAIRENRGYRAVNGVAANSRLSKGKRQLT